MHEVIIHTGQHYSANMDSIFFQELGLAEPEHRFDVNNAAHAPMVGRMVEAVSGVLEELCPAGVVVYGDTNSSLAGALAAKILGLRLAHVEAGLRSFDTSMPEEINRVLIDRIADLLFCPTDKAVANLGAEGFPLGGCRVIQCGDVMLDAALMFRERAKRPAGLETSLADGFFAATVHRAGNTDHPERLAGIMAALGNLALERPVILPLHPRTRKILAASGYDLSTTPITIIDPVGYLNMLWLLDHCALLVTDGGGLQKEAYFLAKPCVTLRDNTEWTELLDAGANVLAGADTKVILKAVRRMLAKSIDFSQPFYGHGTAGERIADVLKGEEGPAC